MMFTGRLPETWTPPRWLRSARARPDKGVAAERG
jgi:hypothetical protein